jgi:hypothetical protein
MVTKRTQSYRKKLKKMKQFVAGFQRVKKGNKAQTLEKTQTT